MADILQTGKLVLRQELQSVQNLHDSLDDSFVQACQMIRDCQGRVVFTGIGHSGHIGAKSASSFSSLCMPACFLHCAEAIHGELGLVSPGDVVILISNSGETAEILTILPRVREVAAGTIAIVGKLESTLARNCNVALWTGFTGEAAPFRFAGSTSAVLTLALCDALAMASAEARGLTEQDYFKNHLGGAVGESLRNKLK